MNMTIARHRSAAFALFLVFAMAFFVTPVAAAEDGFSMGLRGAVLSGNGKPGNDALGGEIYLRRAWNKDTALDFYYGLRVLDLELPAERVFGLSTNDRDTSGNKEDIDSSAEFHALGVRGERAWRPYDNEKISLFASAGLGLAYFTYSNVSGDLAGGGIYRIHDGDGWEIVPSFGAGVRYDLTERLRVELGIQNDYHFSQVEVSATTTIAGEAENLNRKIGNYNEVGVFFGVQYKW